MNFFDSNNEKKHKNTIVMLAAAVIVLQLVAIILSASPKDTDNVQPPVQQGSDYSGSVQNTGTTTQPQQDLPDTAYYNIVPSTGKHASLISRYISWERGQMQPDEVVLSFTGDCTLGTWPEASTKTNFNAVYEEAGGGTYPFDLVKSLFANDDYTYINLETTLTTATNRLQKNTNYNFKGDPEWAQTMIAASYIDGCNLSNNHSYDYKRTGYDETMSSLKAANVDVGSQRDVIVRKVGDVEIVLLGANYITTSYNPEDVFGNELTDLMIRQIKTYKRPDNIVIVNCHWGLERRNDANGDQAQPAHKMIDAGADMIIGHHPHTIQGVELYNGKYIFYSLGNFSFGGKGSTDEVNRICFIARPRFALREGSAVVTGVTVLPCYTTSAEKLSVNNYQPTLVFGEDASGIINTLEKSSGYLSAPCRDFVCPTVDYTFEDVSSTDA